MIVNNFDKLIELGLLEFKEGEFYFLQILQRRKENPDLHGNSKVIKTYYINSLEYFNSIEEEIKQLCLFFNARAYIGLNRRSYKRVAMCALKELTDLILNEQYEAARNAYNTCCGQYTTGDKKWIVDVDTKDESYVLKTVEAIRKCMPITDVDNVIAVLPTINGYHIITRPFNLKQLEPFIATNPLDIHKNNPTLLYYKSTD